MERIKICLTASSGGHLTQVLLLHKIFKNHNYFFVTEEIPLSLSPVNGEKTYFLKQINRRKIQLPFVLIYNAFKSYRILKTERPDLIITTGALAAVPICILAKIFGVKLIFIECYSRIHSASMTGKFLYRFADLFIIQREELLKHYPKALVSGSIF